MILPPRTNCHTGALDLDTGTITIERQLTGVTDRKPTFGPTKGGKTRVVTLGTDTIARLRTHRKHQRELLMANRTTYQDLGLIFAMEPADLQMPTAALEQPVLALADQCFRRFIKAAG